MMLNNIIAQTFYTEVSDEIYNKICSGNWFQKATIELTDNSTHHCFIARIPNTDRIRVKPFEDTTQILTLTYKDINSFIYHLNDSNYYYKYVDLGKRDELYGYRPVQIILSGKINVYSYKWIDSPDFKRSPHTTKPNNRINQTIYFEKDDILIKVRNFPFDTKQIINDDTEIRQYYKKNKLRKTEDYNDFLNIIEMYNKKWY